MYPGLRKSLLTPTYSGVNKRHSPKLSQHKLNFTGNFTACHKHFDISSVELRDSMRQDILNTVMQRTESIMLEHKDSDCNPLYEDPRDVVGKPAKPPRKRNIQGIAVVSPRGSKEGKSLLREQKRKLTKKYESLVTALMDRCEENVIIISEKESQISKLREKLKTVLEYNRLFASDNDRLKGEYTTLASYVEECKAVIREERERNVELEKRCEKLEEKVKHYDMPNKDISTTIPLVEVCMNCSSRQIVLNQTKEQNSRLQKDMQAMKDVLYRLNVQLSRYQERLRSNANTLSTGGKDVFKPCEKYDAFDSLITASLGQKQAPLFDAFQENLQEKDNLILDYEKQFENMNKKSKEIVAENKTLLEKGNTLEQELVQVRQNYKKLVVERETSDIEKATILERAERAESKLKEVYELYEGKMAAMMRDYETVHREYFSVKTALEASAGKMAHFDAMRTKTVPADLHERRLDDCKRLLDELKHQYGMESERKSEQIKKLEEELHKTEDKYNKICQQHEVIKEELRSALKNVRLYRKAAVVFRHRARAAAARATRARRSKKIQNNEPLCKALDALERIKLEIKAVKSRAHTSLEELERRIVEQERRAAHAQAEYRRELERASLALEHKEGIIRSLIDKVADVEEVRLSQTNTHRLQGIVSDSSDKSSPKNEDKKKSSVKLVPGPGGYYQEKEKKKK
ncbi:centrosomal protein of 89 kDa isoform X2 [Bicyclus anynana]|uniref:Centrosomal protein of 89 kDa isoform X2 n=1 Tax=Bicyclus anynana TaxID=110368 RepID=A0A6J1MRQ2_BICAN|nr:centrosomal protein of 89 kDa isoform X2 [Bicyclus anynana]